MKNLLSLLLLFLVAYTLAETNKSDTLIASQRGIDAVVLSPNGKTLVTLSDENTIKFWDASTGMFLRKFYLKSFTYNTPVFSPDGAFLLIQSFSNSVDVYDVNSGNSSINLSFDKVLNSVKYSPDGNKIVVALKKEVQIYDSRKGKKLLTIENKKFYDFMYAEFSPDGKLVMITRADGDLLIHDAGSGKAIQTLSGADNRPEIASFSPDGNKVAALYSDKTVHVWNAKNWKSLFSFTLNGDQDFGLEFSPNSQTLLIRDNDSLFLRSSDKGEPAKVWFGTGKKIKDAKFNSLGDKIVSVDADSTVRVYKVNTGDRIQEFHDSEFTITWAFLYHEERKDSTSIPRLISWSQFGEAKVWNATTQKYEFTLPIHSPYVILAKFSPKCADDTLGGTKVVLVTSNHLIKVVDSKTGKTIHSLPGHKNEITDLKFSSDGRRLISASADKTMKIWDVNSGKLLFDLRSFKNPVQKIVLSHNDSMVVGFCSDEELKVWDLYTGRLRCNLTDDNFELRAVQFAANDRSIITVSVGDQIKTREIPGGKVVYNKRGFYKFIGYSSFSPDLTKIANSDISNNTLEILNIDKSIVATKIEEGNYGILESEFTPDSNYILVNIYGRVLKLYNPETGYYIGTLCDFNDQISSFRFTPNHKKLVVAVNRSIYFYDLELVKKAGAYTGHELEITSFDLCDDGNKIVTTSKDGSTKIWQWETGNILLEF